MNFPRQKGLLLGLLALLAPLPLPLNTVVGWASVATFVLAIGVFMVRTAEGRLQPLPYWAMNVLGLVYIPLFVLDLTVLRQGRVLQPLVHLAMFALAVKLFGMRREKDKWHVFLTAFFLFVAAAGTSVHPAVFLYVLGFLFLAVVVLMRFAGLFSVAEYRRQEAQPLVVPIRLLTTVTVLGVVLGAAPIFFLLPRLRQPYVWAPAGGAGSSVRISGFSDRFDLDVIGRVRSSRTVLMRFSYDTPVPFDTERRFKTAVFDRYESGGWRRSPRPALSVSRSREGLFRLANERSAAWMSIWQRTMGDGKVMLPVEAREIELWGNGLALDEAGVLSFMLPPPATAELRAGLGRGPYSVGPTPENYLGGIPELDPSGITPAIETLAREVMGEGTVIEKARRAEQYLLGNFSYSLDLGAKATDRPVERFLFETRSGHCEYFVSALVLMLRSQAIPARVVSGYLGADFNEWQRYFIVRQSHAHAWVEAYLGEEGWRTLDPTPADGRPAGETTGLSAAFGQAWDTLLFRWDRYVLTYGFSDQVGVFLRLRDLLEGFWGSFGRGKGAADVAVPRVEQGAAEKSSDAAPEIPSWLYATPFAVVVLAALVWVWWKRERFDATFAYRRLRARLGRETGALPGSLAPLEVERRLLQSFPSAGEETRLVVRSYLEESFGGRRLAADEIKRIREALRSARRKWKRAA